MENVKLLNLFLSLSFSLFFSLKENGVEYLCSESQPQSRFAYLFVCEFGRMFHNF